ncbi:MAG: hypothetical protein EOO51_14655 [Flavobacterium sp.]|nr:MAG: hypothetical protein EOO51_14655 [Flavobacterium sp.]
MKESISYPAFLPPEKYDLTNIRELMNKPLLIDVKGWLFTTTVKGTIDHILPYHNETTLIMAIVVRKQSGARKLYSLGQIKAFRKPN